MGLQPRRSELVQTTNSFAQSSTSRPAKEGTQVDIVIVGSGIAGLTAALQLSKAHNITLVTKGELAESNTRWAQGGIAAVMFSDDRIADHIADTLKAGAGLCNPAAVALLCEEGPARIRDLIALGVAFDQREGELAKGLEAAHSYPRVLHAGGDATGLSIETALVRAVRSAPIRILEQTFAVDLVLAGNQVAGLEILTPAGTPQTLAADTVILASGGAGQLFLHTTNPSVATGDGVALALRAGATLADLEFYQFHPTALAAEGATFLISEAVRGDGAVLLDAHGRRFMLDVDPAAELAPRDVVARGIARQMAAQDGAPVNLDATHLGAAFLRERFPTIDAACRARGLDWSTQPIPVTPAAHYWMGGIQTDLDGRTNIPGLYAVGECACTGVHGANRLASNSLLESLVFAHRCAQLFLDFNGNATVPDSGDPGPFASSYPTPSGSSLSPSASRYPGPSGSGLSVSQSQEGASAPGASPSPIDRLTLQTLLWTHAGIERTASDLRKALTLLQSATALGTNVESRETANLLLLARALVTSALAREESRGAHYRLDYPTLNPQLQHQSIYTGVPHDREGEAIVGEIIEVSA